MRGRFAQYSSRNEYFDVLGLNLNEISFDPESIGRYNVVLGMRVLLLSEQPHD